MRLLHLLSTRSRAVIDLASIMIGVLVLSIVTAVGAGTVFGVIPWSQDEAAKNTLRTVATEEKEAYVGDGKYKVTLTSKGTDNVSIGIDLPGSCYIAAVKSLTGNVYAVTSADGAPGPAGAADLSCGVSAGPQAVIDAAH